MIVIRVIRSLTPGRFLMLLLPFCLSCPAARGADPSPPAASQAEGISLREFLVLPNVGRYGRSPVFTDPLEAQIVKGAWSPPSEGEVFKMPDGEEKKWESATAGQDGWLQHRGLRGGYAYRAVHADAPAVMLLDAAGHTMAYVNGEPRAGDPYAYEYVRVPVQLRRGRNDLLFHGSRGRIKAALSRPKAPLLLDARDATLPDLRVGERADTWGAVVLINATAQAQTGLSLVSELDRGKPVRTPLPPLPPLSVRKVGFRIAGQAPKADSDAPLRLQLFGGPKNRTAMEAISLSLRVRRPGQTYKVTFLSDIDGSVQYYAVNPASPAPKNGAENEPRPALFLSLHGAGVEAIGQADAYASKSWGHLVAPTNRRPYGFDWEDWGRIDAMEVLRHARERLNPDPQRIYLTGHSMGGHGTWQVGATFPDRFAALGPSAGWISFFSYGGGRRFENASPVEAMLARAANPSDTLALARNYLHHGVYILHGDADDNVPVTQARTMADHLKPFHRNVTVHEQPGAGHWWDASEEPGADAVDWQPMFDFFARHARPMDDRLRQIEFTTASPGISAWCYWAGIEAQERPLQFSTVKIRFDPHRRQFAGTTDNVARLGLKLDHVPPGETLAVELDGQTLDKIPYPQGRRLLLARRGGKWAVIQSIESSLKKPSRYGPFKEAFRNTMIFVYGTKGTPEENAWAYAKARFDAESFWYRGNGSVALAADTEFRPGLYPDRNVILYGNAETNALWGRLLNDSPVQVRNGEVRFGGQRLPGKDLAVLFLRPRSDSPTASVGVVAGTGIVGMRLTNRMPYFVSGASYPDLTVFAPEMLTEGSRGIRRAGFFGPDWRIESGEFAE